MTNRRMISALAGICLLLCIVGCAKTVPISEQLAVVFDKYQFSSTVSTVNLDSGGYYTTEKVARILKQPSSVVEDYIIANKRIPETAALSITYAEFTNEIDANNTFEKLQTDIKEKLNESGSGYYQENYVIGFYIPQIGNHDNLCLFFLLYKSEKRIVYVNEQGPVSFVDQNQGLVNDICKTVGLDPSENYTIIRQKLDE